MAPDFALPDDRGQLVRLSNYRGRKVVLYFYPEDDTPACTREACAFRDRFGDIQLHGAVILGVSADPVESHRKFKAKYRLNFPLLSDADRKVLRAYDVWQEKTMFGRTYMGVVRSTFIIDETGRIAKVFTKVKVDGHAAEVVATL
ncbi:thioredoxin-dependent thiol peroxidase [bacterium]|nr:thioredoxin-dependent thiol peroxidase [bacterium]